MLGDGDGVGVTQRVPAVFVGSMPAIHIDRIGNAIPSGGGHLGGIAARRDGIPLGRRHNAFGEADRHTVVNEVEGAIYAAVGGEVGAVASVGGGHYHVLDTATSEQE